MLNPRRISLILFCFMLCSSSILAEEKPANKKLVKYPSVEIDLVNKEIRIDSEISSELNWGTPALEFILLAEKSRAYESFFLTTADPMHIQLGLLMLGLKPAPLPETVRDKDNKKEGELKKPPLLEVLFEYESAGKKIRVPVSKFMSGIADGKEPQNLLFAFTGSYFYDDTSGENHFAATSSGEVITMLFSNQSLINLPYLEKSPYQEGGFELIVDKLPAEFTTKKDFDIYQKGIITRTIVKTAPAIVIIKPAEK